MQSFSCYVIAAIFTIYVSPVAANSHVVHAGILDIPDFDAIVKTHFPARQDEYFNPYNPNQEEGVRIFGLPKFHKARGEAYHTEQDPEHTTVSKKLTRIGSVSKKLCDSNIGEVLEICPGASQPILRGQLASDRLRNVFATMDRDGSGDLSVDEITECFARIGLSKSGKEVESVMNMFDGDADARITFREFEECIRKVAARAAEEGLLETLQLHPGTWIKQLPDEVPNLEIGSMHYRVQWIGEEKMGGCWSSDANPLSGDRPKDFIESYQPKETLPEDKHVTTDVDGHVHVCSKKSAESSVGTHASAPTSVALRASTMLI
eukprot:CAMPEP_0196729342 /NCGR_PEP_ID=MMETSP1091-20130531/9759_1 /TAXON_ID=302021 /ORGANISM="Rhodomonas sp., Strain CCMP768" /LENGTH=319 /DNA_ID=CAMNT_0042072221 /DNA_START=159 /DNA_END=1118 /DNA_ORIENTATION=-